MRRLALLAAVAVFLPPAAQAKLPAFSVELVPSRPAPGEPVTVTVRPKSSPEGFPDRLDDLLAFERPEQSLPVPLVRAGDVYRAVVTFPHAGRWTLRPFPKAGPRLTAREVARLGYAVPPGVEVVGHQRSGRFSIAVLAVALAIAAAARAAGP